MNTSEFQRSVSNYSGYTEIGSGPRIEKVRKLFAQFEGKKRILDVGCSNGGVLLPFVGSHEIHGVDISEFFINLANERGISAIRHDLEKDPLPHADKSFDVVFCGETIEHQVDTDWLLAEINRVLKPGGKLILTFPNIRTALGVAMLLFFDMPPMYAARYRASHVRDFTLKTIKIALRARGFRFERAIGSAFYLPKVGEFGSALASIFPSWAHTVIVVASKEKDSPYSAEELINTEIY